MTDTYQAVGPQPEQIMRVAAGAMVLDGHGRLLCQLRDDFDGVSEAGKWGFFGGHLEHGETPRQAVARELREELGLVVSEADFEPLAKFRAASSADTLVLILRLVPTVRPAEIRLGEGAGFAFLTRRQIATLDFIDSYARFFDMFFD